MASVARYFNMDKTVLEFAKRYTECNILYLGAGLETAYDRLNEKIERRTVHWYAADLPEVIEARKKVFGQRKNETLIAGDMFKLEWVKEMDNSLPTLLIVSGVFQYFHEEEIIAFIKACGKAFSKGEMLFDATSESGLKFTNWFIKRSLALETGMRIGEIIGLKWSDIDFVNRTIYVNRTLVYIKSDNDNSPNYNKWGFEFHEPKTDKGRRKIPMTLKAYQVLKRQQLWKRGMETKGYKAPEGYEDLVFTTTKNTPISPRDTTVVMKYITERIRKKKPDFEPVTPHTLRHTFATRYIERGMNPKTLQIILGHSTIQLTMNLYCHVTDDMLISEMSKFEAGSRHEPRTSCAIAHSVTGVAL